MESTVLGALYSDKALIRKIEELERKRDDIIYNINQKYLSEIEQRLENYPASTREEIKVLISIVRSKIFPRPEVRTVLKSGFELRYNTIDYNLGRFNAQINPKELSNPRKYQNEQHFERVMVERLVVEIEQTLFAHENEIHKIEENLS